MDKNPLVSVLMTVYNREKYIAEAIDSVLASTYKNWELIIVDDRSKDKSVSIAQSYAAKDDRIKIFINEKNLGDYPNRNKAASYAQGKYLKYVDADDIIYEHTLYYMVSMMERFPEAGWATFSVQQDTLKPHPFLLTPKEQYEGHYIHGAGYFLRSPLSAILNTDIFREEGGFEEKKMVGDFEMWNRLGLKYNLLVMPHSHGFVWYREHDDQQSSDINEYEGSYRKIAMEFIRREDCDLEMKTKKLAISKLKKRYYKRILKLLLGLNFSQIRYS